MPACVHCQHFRLKQAGRLAEHGFGLCSRQPAAGHHVAARYQRQCGHYAAAPGDVSLLRLRYLEDQERQR